MSASDIQKLKDLAKTDATVAKYFNMLSGDLSFEDMIVMLAIQLVADKSLARRQLKDAIKGKDHPTIFGLDLES